MIEDEEDAPQAGGREPDESSEDEDVTRDGGFHMPPGFAQLLLPNLDDFLASTVAPLQEQMRSVMPDYSDLARDALAPMNERLQHQMASIVASVPTFSVPSLDLPTLQVPVLIPATRETLERISEQHAKFMEGLRECLVLLFNPEELRGLNRALLPANLKEHADEIRAGDVYEFVEQEGIPLYLVPRGGRRSGCCGRRIAQDGDECSAPATSPSWRTAPPCWNWRITRRSAMS